MKALLDHDNESCISLLVNLPRKLKLKILDIPPFIKIDLSTRYPRKNHTRIRAIKHPKDRKPFAHSIFFHRYTRNYRQIFPFFYFFFLFYTPLYLNFSGFFKGTNSSWPCVNPRDDWLKPVACWKWRTTSIKKKKKKQGKKNRKTNWKKLMRFSEMDPTIDQISTISYRQDDARV